MNCHNLLLQLKRALVSGLMYNQKEDHNQRENPGKDARGIGWALARGH
jgi:hypothetical protein